MLLRPCVNDRRGAAHAAVPVLPGDGNPPVVPPGGVVSLRRGAVPGVDRAGAGATVKPVRTGFRCTTCRKILTVRGRRVIVLDDGMWRIFGHGYFGVRTEWSDRRERGESADPYCDDCSDTYRALEALRA